MERVICCYHGVPIFAFWVHLYTIRPMQSNIIACLLTLLGLGILGGIVWAAMMFVTVRLGVPSGYWLVPTFGALGGIVGGIIRSQNQDKLKLCRFEGEATINLGVLGDIAIGLGGASALVFLFGGTLLQFDPDKATSLVLIVSVSFVAGAYGRNIVEAAGDKLLRKAEEISRSAAKEEARSLVGLPATLAFTYAARDLTDRGEYHQALDLLHRALQNEPNYPGAYVEEGRALKRLGRLQEALSSVEKALKLNPEKPEALYNRACYDALLGKPLEGIVSDLKKAIEFLPSLRNEATKDPDLQSVRNSQEFKEIIQHPEGA